MHLKLQHLKLNDNCEVIVECLNEKASCQKLDPEIIVQNKNYSLSH